MDFWTYPRQVDEDFSQLVRAFLDEIYPVSQRPAGFERNVDKNVYAKVKAWQRDHVDGGTPSQEAAFRREAEHAGLNMRERSSTEMVAKVLEVAGTHQQRTEIVPRFRRGELQCALGYTEPDSGSDVAAAQTRAVRDGNLWVINGQKIFTSNADTYSHVFLLTRTDPAAPKHHGLTMFLVPLAAAGVEVRRIETLGYHHTCMTFYDDVTVPDSARVGGVNEGWSVMRLALDIEHGAGPRAPKKTPTAGSRGDASPPALGEGSGETAELVRRTAEWAHKAGRPGGSRAIDDPMVRQRLARLVVGAEVARLIGHRNDALRMQAGTGNGSKLFWTELYQRASSECLDIVGPDGLLPYSEAGAACAGYPEYAFRSSQVLTIVGGCSEVQRDIIAERRLGLPKPRPHSTEPPAHQPVAPEGSRP
jgi:alkylation response protein AidB-like acyl-CoA dehydrogenase